MSEWKTCRIDEIADINASSYSPKENWQWINYLDTGSITENHIVDIQRLDVLRDKIPSRAKRKAHEGSIVYSTVRPNQRHYGLIKDVPGNFLVSTGFSVLDARRSMVEPRYLYYYLSQDEVVRHLQSVAEQSVSTYPSLNPSDIGELRIHLPPLPTQRKIAAVLGAIDDKIENNRKICATLEVQAQAIFKSWFVDFEPWGGKMPEGWGKGTLADIGEIVGGATPSKDKSEYYSDEGIAWITPKDISNQSSKFISKGENDITSLGFKSASVKMLPRGTVLFSSRAPIGYVAIASNDLCTNQGFKSVVPREDVGTAFVYEFLKSNVPVIEGRASGSTFKEISAAGMRDIPIIVPDSDVTKTFETKMRPLYGEQEVLELQTRALAAIRDALLPKLMSGEIDVEKVKVA